MKKQYWVPEKMLFENAGDCLDKHPDEGAAALVVCHTSYDSLEKVVRLYEEALESIEKPAPDSEVPEWEDADVEEKLLDLNIKRRKLAREALVKGKELLE